MGNKEVVTRSESERDEALERIVLAGATNVDVRHYDIRYVPYPAYDVWVIEYEEPANG